MMKTAKFWAIMVTIVAVMAFAKWAHGAIYDAGYDAANVEWQREVIKLTEEIRAEEKAVWKISSEAAVDNIIIEEKIVERIKIVERDVPRIVKEFVTPQCRDLGPDIQRVFNNAIRAAAEGLPRPADTAELVKSVPGTDTG